MIERLGKSLTRWFERYMPDPFVLAIVLTFVVFAAALTQTLAQGGPTAWYERVIVLFSAWKSYLFEPKLATGRVDFSLLYFAFQMCLMLVTGYALADARPVHRMIERVAAFPKDSPTAAAMVAFVACCAALLHWGLGVVIGALLAKEVARQGRKNGIAMHYPLLGAAGYTALLIWHGGLSGSIPLKATKGIPAASIAPILKSDTLFSSLNILLSVLMLAAIPLFCYLLHPKERDRYVPYDPARNPEDTPSDADETATIVDATTRSRGLALIGTLLATWILRRGSSSALDGTRIGLLAANAILLYLVLHVSLRLLITAWRRPQAERHSTLPKALANSRLFTLVLAWLGLGILQIEIATGKAVFGFNLLNFSFLFLGILFQETPRRYVGAVVRGTASCSGIILQFPFYFGILGLMRVSGLAESLTHALASISTATTYPVVTFFSAGIVNLFVPSGGGQWVVQGEIVIKGAQKLMVSGHTDLVGRSVMALAYGDAWTNMLQPFWAIPLLAITGLRAQEIIGYSAALMLFSGALTIIGLLVF
ncbi:MAG: short-chain fatty acid transporter [Myxococcales bacterium]|nr:short-chain fatty acid transporter [Myxococcales bacterium]